MATSREFLPGSMVMGKDEERQKRFIDVSVTQYKMCTNTHTHTDTHTNTHSY